MIEQASGGEALVTTDGSSFYKVIRPWARLPGGREFGPVSQLVADSAGRVIVVQRIAPAVLIFAPDGSLETSWHHPKLASVHGICLCADETLLITSFDLHQVLRFDKTGRLLQELGTFNRPAWNDPFNHPTDVAVAADGDMYVTDGYGNARVHRFGKDGCLIQSWGRPGVAPGEFCCPHGVWITPDNRVVVLDRDNSRAQVFDRDGHLLDVWPGLVKPMDIWGDAGGTLFVSDQTPRIVKLDARGRVAGGMRAFTIYPHGLWGDRAGNLFVAEQLPFGVAKYERMVQA
jgi:DNA-binding beta-propeller fold protein YncE